MKAVVLSCIFLSFMTSFSVFAGEDLPSWYRFYIKHPPKKELILNSSVPFYAIDANKKMEENLIQLATQSMATHQVRVQQGALGIGFKVGGLYRIMLPLRNFKSGPTFVEATVLHVLFKNKGLSFHKVIGLRYESFMGGTKRSWQEFPGKPDAIGRPSVQPVRAYYAEWFIDPKWNLGLKFNSILVSALVKARNRYASNHLELVLSRRFSI